MKLNLRKIQRSSSKISKNISSKLRKNKFFNLVLNYKYPFIFVTVLSLFIGKNIFLLGSYSSEIASLEQDVKIEEAKTKQLKENIKYYNTDEFVYRYALDNLNMRPTRKSKLIHLDIKPSDDDKSSSGDHESDEDTNRISDDENNQHANNDTNSESNSSETSNEQSDSESTSD